MLNLIMISVEWNTGREVMQIAGDCYPRPLMTVTLRPEGGVPARMMRR